MFDALKDRFENIFASLRGKGKLTEEDISAAMREVRRALLEADVNYQVVKQLTEAIKVRALDVKVVNSITPSEQIYSIVYEELIKVMEVHYPVLDKRGEKSSTAITGMDLHDIARACRMMNKASGGNFMSFGLGKSNAKVYVKSTEGIRFSDVAGEDEAKENLAEIVSYLHDPSQYREIGASMTISCLEELILSSKLVISKVSVIFWSLVKSSDLSLELTTLNEDAQIISKYRSSSAEMSSLSK